MPADFEIMFPLLSQFFSRRPSATGSAGVLPIVWMVVLSGLVLVCFMASSVSVDVWEAAYRMLWLVFCSLAMLIYFVVSQRGRKISLRSVILATIVILVQLLLMMMWFSLWGRMGGKVGVGHVLLAIPYLLGPMVASVLTGRERGVFVALVATLFGVALLPRECPPAIVFNYLVVSLVGGVVSAALSSRVHKREQILYAGFATGAVVFVVAFSLGALQESGLASLAGKDFDFRWFSMELVTALGVNFIVAVLINGAMPLLERVFNISTPITWLEWADMNHPVLSKLSMNAPGTFHHSLMVQRLSEAAAEAVGADVTRAGVSALYHDIGKLRNPQYFAENISDQNLSPHNDMTPESSARVITAHVTDGVEIAQKYRLNRRIIDVIREHHGVSTAYFFYRKALDLYNEEKERFDEGLTDTCPDEVDKSVFTYKGPIPQSRESGIVSMADAVESAVRSLHHPTEDDIRSMIDGIFKGRILDGHLQDCGLTLGEIAIMKECFFATIRTMNHNRIAYPKPQEGDATAALAARRQSEEKKASAVVVVPLGKAPEAKGQAE